MREHDPAQEEADGSEIDPREQAIAEYLGEFRELKLVLQAAGQTVSKSELAVRALKGLPEEFATLVELLELGEEELTPRRDPAKADAKISKS